MITFPNEALTHEQMHVNDLFWAGRFLDPSESAISNAMDQVLLAVNYLRGCGRPVSREIDFAIHWGNSRTQIELTAS
ncbi:hypothetical protein D3C86_1831430 [compost metagenome]